MTSDKKPPEGFSLKRWSRVKLDAKRASARPLATEPPLSVAPASETVVPATETVVPATETVVPANAGTQRLSPNVTASTRAWGRQEPASATPVTTAGTASPPGAPPAELPPIESLTIDSDFTAFLRPKVDEALKRKALKKLFGDPHFNVMDRLDVYIDDYSQPDPLAPEIARQLVQARAILDARPTRINAQGILEDVPPAEPETAAAPITQEPLRVEPSIADTPAPIAADPTPEADAEPSARAAEKAASTDLAPKSETKAGADSR